MGDVANNGTFVLSDRTSRQDFGGIFWAFDRCGNVLIRQVSGTKLRTAPSSRVGVLEILERIGVSADGKYAACDWRRDSNTALVICFDLQARGVISQFVSEIRLDSRKGDEAGRSLEEDRRTTRYQIDSEARTVGVVNGRGEVFRYSFAGQLLDREAWQQAWLQQADGYQLLHYVRQKLASGDQCGSGQVFIDLLRRSLHLGVSVHTQGIVHSVIGEIYERAGRLDEAIKMYEAALELAPNLPLKRKLKELKAQRS